MLSFISFALSLFIDGATDCANSVTGAVSSKALSVKKASLLCAVFGFLGMVIFSLFFPAVAENSALIASFPEGEGESAVVASLLSVFIWSLLAWLWGIPTSEGQGLLCAMAGSALALGGDVSFADILILLLWSVPAVLMSGSFTYIFVKMLEKRNKPEGSRLRFLLIAASATAAFFHGAQDGQKFFALSLCTGTLFFESSALTVLILSACMAAGTFFAGGRIIQKMEEVSPKSTFSALVGEFSGSLVLLMLTFLGAPVSTTQIKSSALIFAKAAEGRKSRLSDILLLLLAWIATLPVCFSLSFCITKLFFAIIL